MIDWKSIKKAAELPYATVDPFNDAPVRNMSPTFNADLFAPKWDKKTPPSADKLRKSPVGPWNNPFSGVGQSVKGTGPMEGVYVQNVPRESIRPLLYNNPAREQAETQRAYLYRWKRLWDMTDDAGRQELLRRYHAGQIPPVIMRGVFDSSKPLRIEDKWFQRPGEYVQATVAPSTGGSASNPYMGQIFIGSPNWDLWRAYREEFAHDASYTPMPKDMESFIQGVGGGRGYRDFNGPSAYEIKPSEMTRMALLAKAAAARLNLPPIRTVEDLYHFAKLRDKSPRNNASMPSPGTADNPYAGGIPSGGWDASTDPANLLKVLDTMRWGMNHGNNREYWTEKYNMLYNALQDAIDMASVRRDDGTLQA